MALRGILNYIVAIMSLSALAIAEGQPQLDGPMRQVFQSLMNLQPFATSAERFADPKNREIIQKDMKVVVGLRHRIRQMWQKLSREWPSSLASSPII